MIGAGIAVWLAKRDYKGSFGKGRNGGMLEEYH